MGQKTLTDNPKHFYIHLQHVYNRVHYWKAGAARTRSTKGTSSTSIAERTTGPTGVAISALHASSPKHSLTSALNPTTTPLLSPRHAR